RHTRCLSDWSSDVCSSDLSRVSQALFGSRQRGACAQKPHAFRALLTLWPVVRGGEEFRTAQRPELASALPVAGSYFLIGHSVIKIGRASCRERVWRWVGVW